MALESLNAGFRRSWEDIPNVMRMAPPFGSLRPPPLISPRFRAGSSARLNLRRDVGEGAGRQIPPHSFASQNGRYSIVPLLLNWWWSRRSSPIVNPTRFVAMVLRRITARDGDCDLTGFVMARPPFTITTSILTPGQGLRRTNVLAPVFSTSYGLHVMLAYPSQKIQRSVPYFVCERTSTDLGWSWDDYSNKFDCSSLPQQFASPFIVSTSIANGRESISILGFLDGLCHPRAHGFQLGSGLSLRPWTFIHTNPGSASENLKHFISRFDYHRGHGDLTPSRLEHLPTGPTIRTQAGKILHPLLMNLFSAGAVAGIVLGICLMVSVAVFIYLRMRRHRRREQPEAAGDVSPISPYTAYTSSPGAWNANAKVVSAQPRRTAHWHPAILEPPSTASSPATPSVPLDARAWNVPGAPGNVLPFGRRHPQPESRAVQRRTDLDNAHASTDSTVTASAHVHAYPAGGSNARALSTVGASNAAPDPDVVLQLRAMAARVRELEAHVESESPPGYSGHGRSSTRVSRQS
ncbi:hypothetical protein GGX14DRAFT_403116 [Mycena pura]|uniref:Uncharacterized protein n=1 Tax=Mycena pura TaxID=153505 RepID=A0AAD6Y2Y7_9AGAR|nr:hypothetical protein GGX14DRAFT_403116 [Mycena pura]